MSSPNHAMLERISAAWHVLATHQDLPAAKAIYFVNANETQIHVHDASAVDSYADAFGVPRAAAPGRGWLKSTRQDVWSYMRYGATVTVIADDLPEPLPQQGVETAEDSGPDRSAAVV